MIFYNAKMSDSDTSFYYESSSDDDFHDDIDGGLLDAHTFINPFGTRYIDCTLNAIANSDALVEEFKNELRPDITPEVITKVFESATPITNLKIIPKTDNYEELYRLLISLYITAMDKCEDVIVLTIRTYLMYIENIERFYDKYTNREKLKPISFDTPFKTIENIDANFNLYILLCQKSANKNKTIKTSGVKDYKLLQRIGIKTYYSRSTISDIKNILNDTNEHDVFIYMLSYKGDFVSNRFKMEDENYTLTDMFISEYSHNGNSFCHTLYYDFIKHELQSDATKNDTTVDDIYRLIAIEKTHAPTLLHFQIL